MCRVLQSNLIPYKMPKKAFHWNPHFEGEHSRPRDDKLPLPNNWGARGDQVGSECGSEGKHCVLCAASSVLM